MIGRRHRQVLVGLLLLGGALAVRELRAEGSVEVENGAHRVEITRAERHEALMDGMLRPEDPSEAFLLVFLLTDDPCLDPQRAASCLADKVEAGEVERGAIEPDESLAWSCGSVVLSDGGERLADGGGILDGELACSYVVPRRSKRLRLALRGYPEIELEPALSAAD